jgi:transcriptional regulator with XRE-family HTH domain
MPELAPFGFAGRNERTRPLLRTMLGQVLRRIRLAQQRTLADVARSARVSLPYLSEVERGRKEASSEVLAAICEALRTDLSDVLAEVGHDLTDVADQRARRDRDRILRLGVIPERANQPDLPDGWPSPPDSRSTASGIAGDGLPPRSGPAEALCLLAA